MAVAVAALTGASAALYGTPTLAADATRNKQWHLRFLKVAEAQRVSTGRGVIVAVVDSGVADHPDLAGSVLDGTDFIKQESNGRIDRAGHGTAMAGLIAAHGNDGSGALGFAPDSKILPIRVFDKGPKSAAIGDAIKYAISHGAKVINLSLGGTLDVMTGAIQYALSKGVVVVVAAGNSGFLGPS